MTAFIAGVILLLNLWIGKRTGVSVAPEKAMADIDRCLYVLKTLENRWQMAGRLWDILHGLATMRSETIPAEHVSRKRSRQPNAVEAHDVGTTHTPTSEIASAPPHLNTPHFGYDPGISEMAALNLSSGSDSNQNISHYPQPLDHGLETILPTAVDSGAVMTNDGAWFNIPMHFDVDDWEFFVASINEFNQNAPR